MPLEARRAPGRDLLDLGGRCLTWARADWLGRRHGQGHAEGLFQQARLPVGESWRSALGMEKDRDRVLRAVGKVSISAVYQACHAWIFGGHSKVHKREEFAGGSC